MDDPNLNGKDGRPEVGRVMGSGVILRLTDSTLGPIVVGSGSLGGLSFPRHRHPCPGTQVTGMVYGGGPPPSDYFTGDFPLDSKVGPLLPDTPTL